jgi:hypothetical protein
MIKKSHMKTQILLGALMISCTSYAQMARSIVDDACHDGAKLYSRIGRTNVLESYKIASETEANSPERKIKLQILERQLDEAVGRLKLANRESQEEWVRKGINRDIAALRRQTLDATIYIAISLASKNPNWDLNRLIIETQEQCEISIK